MLVTNEENGYGLPEAEGKTYAKLFLELSELSKSATPHLVKVDMSASDVSSCHPGMFIAYEKNEKPYFRVIIGNGKVAALNGEALITDELKGVKYWSVWVVKK